MGLSREQALEYCNSDDLIGIGMEADAVRRGLHPEGVVSYVVDATVCCTDGPQAIEAKIDDALSYGVTGLHLRAKDRQTLEEIAERIASIKARFPSLWLHGLSAQVVLGLAAQAGTSTGEVLTRLRDAGLGSLAGDDAGILDDAVQAHAPKCKAAEWLAVHHAAHALGMPTTAGMTFGMGETMEHRVNHLLAISRLQEETGGFTAFTPVAFQPATAGVAGFEEATAVEYLRMLAVSRIYLDCIANIQADWASQGLKVLQMTLRFGANDVGTTLPPEMIPAAEGTTEEDLRRVIRGAGFRPVQRDTVYRSVFLS